MRVSIEIGFTVSTAEGSQSSLNHLITPTAILLTLYLSGVVLSAVTAKKVNGSIKYGGNA